MRIGSFTPVNGRVRDIIINRPIHKLLFKLKGGMPLASVGPPPLPFFNQAPMVLRIDMQDNVNSGTTPIVPHVNLSTLSEISSRREGFCIGHMEQVVVNSVSRLVYNMSYPVTLAPAGNMDLDANKFLLCDLSDLPSDVEEVEVYGIELDTPSAILLQYNKFNIAKGINRQPFTAQGQLLVLPTEGFEEVQITYAGGVVTTKTLFELEYLTAINNDIVSAIMQVGSSGGVMHSAVFGFRNALLLDLEGVQSFEIIRDNAQMSAEQFDLLMVDFGQDRLTDATMRRLWGGSFRAALNTDGTVSLVGAERVRVGNPLDQSITRLPAEALAMGNVAVSALV